MAPTAETDEPLTEKNGSADASKRRRRGAINRPLVLLKVSLFLIFGATSSLVPYLTIHMQSLGLTVAEIATVYLTLLVTTCLSPPVTGYLVDRFGRYKPVLLVALVCNLVAHQALDMIPRRQPFELVVMDRVMVTEASPGIDGTIALPRGCKQGDCPIMDHLAKQINKTCTPSTNSDTFYEVLMNRPDPNSKSCGLISLVNCSVTKEIFLRPITLKCQRPNSQYDRTFWYYLIIRFFAMTMLTATLTITDPIALAMIEQYGGDFGREKLYSSVGMAIFTPLTGLMIDYFSKDHHGANFAPAFYTYDVLLGLSLLSVLFLPISKKLPSESIMKHLFQVLRLPHVLIFIVFLFFLGNFWGFIESYLFVIMVEMGSPNYLLGLTYTVGTVTSIPMMYLTGRITRWAGHVNLLVVAFLAHACRILGYSFIENPFWCFPIELNEAISCYFMWVVATTYCAVLAPGNLVATLIGVSGMVHFCLGKGIGSFFGGFLIVQHGTRMAFRYMGYIAVVCGICYKFLHLIWLKKFDKPPSKDAGKDALVMESMLKERVSLVSQTQQFENAKKICKPIVDSKV